MLRIPRGCSAGGWAKARSAVPTRALAVGTLRFAHPTFLRNDRQQHVVRSPAAEMQRRGATKNLRRAVDRIVVQERPAAFQLVLEVRQLASARAAVFVVLAADGERDPMARRHHGRGRPAPEVQLAIWPPGGPPYW